MVGTRPVDGSSRRKRRNKKIVVGLKSQDCGREMLLCLLNFVVSPGDYVLAVHVQVATDDAFDINRFFHLHEALCKSKNVEFQVKVCTGSFFITVLANEVKLNSASILVLGSSSSSPNYSSVLSCLQVLPPACCLQVMDNRGQVLVRERGASQCNNINHTLQCLLTHDAQSRKELPEVCTSTKLPLQSGKGWHKVINRVQCQFRRLTISEPKEALRQFTSRELRHATDDFSPKLVIGESKQSTVYKGNLKDGQAIAVKVIDITKSSKEQFFQEVDILGGLKHDYIVRVIGYCFTKDMHAVVYYLLNGSLQQNLQCLGWKKRMTVAVGVAKALQYLHHTCSPPIVHRDVKSSNILLSHNCHPQLSDFGMAIVNNGIKNPLAAKDDHDVVGTFGYLAPEYVMYGKIDKKIDVYSYGVVLLELITGKTAIQKITDFEHGSLVLWARSLLSRGLSTELIDPELNDDYDKEEMQRMLTAARFCIRQSSSKRPSITKIVKLLEEPEYWKRIMMEKEECVNETGSE